ncbi:MAG: Do family serine endopeptidase [Armatimonadetes bacterium]|nr:Do family serine endopeptidase [Armatimonadota bacterium]MDW8121278.1 Do family serine endopeptidase [Armatimonadota bacterium]
MSHWWQTGKGRATVLLATIGLSLAMGAGLTRWLTGMGPSDRVVAVNSAASMPEPLLRAAEQLQEAFVWVARTVEPATVTIVVPIRSLTTRLRRFQPPRTFPEPFESDPFFREFFRRFFGEEGPQGPPAPSESEGEERPRWVPRGSGVIIRSDGYILTNRHVIEGIDQIAIMLSNGKRLSAQLVGSDEQTDLAVLKVDPRGERLTEARLGDSDQVRVGEWAIAIGNPFGFRQTLTVGVVSAIGRNPRDPRMGAPVEYTEFIQTDAAINQGNSGGPLCNIRGEVIGINTAIFSPTGGSVGIGFAIPINTAKFVVDQILRNGKVVRGWLGVHIMDAEALDDPSALGGKDVAGAVVREVIAGSPGEKGGLQPDDIIVGFNGIPVRSSAHLQSLIGRTPPGTTVTLKVLRGGQEKTITVTLGERTDEVVAMASKESRWRGMTVGELTPELRRDLGLPPTFQGVVVKQVDVDSPAGQNGVEPGDVITAMASQPVRSIADFLRITRSLNPDQTVAVTLRRGSSTMMRTIPAR